MPMVTTTRSSLAPRPGVLAALAALSLVGLGCGTYDDSYPYYPPVATSGTAVFDWTVAATKDPRACTQFGAVAIRIAVTSTAGRDAGSFSQSCGDFSTEIVLAPDDYYADVYLTDGSGLARSTTIPIQPFTIHGNDRLILPIDFPADSFYPPGAVPASTNASVDAGP